MSNIFDALLKAIEAFIRNIIGADITLKRQDLAQSPFWLKMVLYGLVGIAVIFAVLLAIALWESRSTRGGAAILYMAVGLALTLLALAAFYFFSK